MVAVQGSAKGQQVVGERWSIVVSRQHEERTARENLVNQQFEVYLPMLIKEAKPTKMKPKPGLVALPLFSTYLFVRFDPTVAGWKRIFSTRGVRAMFMAGDRPLVVPDRVIEMIQAREENGFIKIADVDGDIEGRWSRGDKVRVNGNTADYEAVFEERIDRNRALVLINLLGRSVPKEVHLLTLQ